MLDIYKLMQKVAPTDATVFITGQTGTGKDLVAKTIHQFSPRSKSPFVAINCGSIARELVTSALFGHERGSFTGANQTHKGYFEQADGGTLFLDELPETTPEFQVALLRVLETGKIIPVGGKRQITVDVRVIAATNRNPYEAIKHGVLRDDVFHRLNTFPIAMPPLNKRPNDIKLISHYFLDFFNKKFNKSISFHRDAIDFIENKSWSGNVRELKNFIYRAFILADKSIDTEQLAYASNLDRLLNEES